MMSYNAKSKVKRKIIIIQLTGIGKYNVHSESPSVGLKAVRNSISAKGSLLSSTRTFNSSLNRVSR